MYWRRRTRRLFITSLPFALAIWLLLLVSALIIRVAIAVISPISLFWNQPRSHRFRYTHYSYNWRARRSAGRGRQGTGPFAAAEEPEPGSQGVRRRHIVA